MDGSLHRGGNGEESRGVERVSFFPKPLPFFLFGKPNEDTNSNTINDNNPLTSKTALKF